ncbi:RDD family protein [Gemmatimonadota bacterium]
MDNIGFGKRLGALLLDMLCFGIPMNLVQLGIFGQGAWDVNDPAYIGAFFFSTAVGISYFVGMWAFADGATLGKKILKIKIVKNDGSPIGLGTALGRYFSYILASIPCALGLFWVIWDKEKRGWHDKLAGTKVIDA